MSFRFHVMAAAALGVLAAASAQATLTVDTNQAFAGSSSLLFVGYDRNGTFSSGNSVTIDLGFLAVDMLAGPGTQGVPATGSTFSAGSLSGPATSVVWDFKHNTMTVNGVASANTIAYSAQFSSFLSGVSNSGGDWGWGVIAAERSNSGSSPNAGNPIANNNLLVTVQNLSDMPSNPGNTPISTAAGNMTNFVTSTIDHGTQSQSAGTQGANYETTGSAYVGTLLNGNVGGVFANGGTMLNSAATTSSTYFNWLQQASPSQKFYTLDAVSYGTNRTAGASPFEFTYDPSAGTLTYAAPVPEPGSFAMLAAGLGAIGLMVRRRSAR